MPQKITNDHKKTICQEFAASNSYAKDFCKKKGISSSSLTRWKKQFNNKDNTTTTSSSTTTFSKFKQLKATQNNDFSSKFNPIQIILTTGVKINIPPKFCNESLSFILKAMKQYNA